MFTADALFRTFTLGVLLWTAACARPNAAARQSPESEPAADLSGLHLPDPRAPHRSESDLARRASAAFRQALLAGRYEALPGITRLLSAAYLENPHDPEIALLLAHAHLWRISERARLDTPDPSITDHLILAERYFEQAYRLSPEDHRIIGWLGTVRLSLGRLHQDEALERQGHRLLQEAVRRYPQFNHFTAGYVLGGYPRDHAWYREALDHMQRNIGHCSGVRSGEITADRSIYDLAARADDACANSASVPHNFEGFLMSMGDMLMKAGDPRLAQAFYVRAREAPAYGSWPYRELLERRIAQAGSAAAGAPGDRLEMMSGSAYSCTACHARSSAVSP